MKIAEVLRLHSDLAFARSLNENNPNTEEQRKIKGILESAMDLCSYILENTNVLNKGE